MPHIKVTPFSTARLDRLIKNESFFSFRACINDASSQLHEEELLGVEFEGEAFVLEIHKREQAFLIKPDKPTRPLDVNRIKRALAYLTDKADLEIVHDNIALSPTKPALAEAFNERIEDFEEADFGGRDLAIEVGFGSGRHLLHQAKEHPDVLHIGIEIHTPSAQQVLKQIQLQGLTNVWVVNYDARLLLEMIPSNTASVIFVHFPVPWDKKPHRRVVSDPFVVEALRILGPGGYLELRTDSDRYYAYALEVFSRPSMARFDVTKNHEAAIRSKYEDRWQRQSKDIYTLRLYCDERSEAIRSTCSFVFDRPLKPLASLLELSDRAILKSDHFVHFERRYRMVSEEGALIRCSFGSFDRPEHKLIAVRDGRAAYYPQRPVRSSTNAKAHQTIGESIYA